METCDVKKLVSERKLLPARTKHFCEASLVFLGYKWCNMAKLSQESWRMKMKEPQILLIVNVDRFVEGAKVTGFSAVYICRKKYGPITRNG